MAKKRSKRYRKAAAVAPKQGERLSVPAAVAVLQSLPPAKFDETVEIAIRLGIDAKKADQLVRGSFSLPHGLGKQKRVIAFCDGPDAEAAREAGAIEVGTKDLAEKIAKGWMDFDVAIAHPSAMRFVGRLGRVLGPQGKMPSPKSGTVTPNVGLAVSEFKGGKLKYKNDKEGNIHAPVGKRSFPADKLAGNVQAFIDHIKSVKPAAAKGMYLQNISVATTMGPSVELSLGA